LFPQLPKISPALTKTPPRPNQAPPLMDGRRHHGPTAGRGSSLFSKPERLPPLEIKKFVRPTTAQGLNPRPQPPVSALAASPAAKRPRPPPPAAPRNMKMDYILHEDFPLKNGPPTERNPRPKPAVKDAEVAFVGGRFLPDIPILKRVGLAVAVR